MKRKQARTVPVELVVNDSDREFDRFMKLGHKQTEMFLHRSVYISGPLSLSVSDALALAYLHGVWHGWDVKERHDARAVPIEEDGEYILGLS